MPKRNRVTLSGTKFKGGDNKLAEAIDEAAKTKLIQPFT